MATIDLDAARAARRENSETDETPTATFAGTVFELPREMPFGVFLRMAELQEDPETALDVMGSFVSSLFGPRAEEFLALGPSMDDLLALMAGLSDGYGIDTGKASASPDSASSTTAPSKRTTKRSTASSSA